MTVINADVLNGYLYGLGDTPTQVAESLAALGIKGKRYQAGSCPIAKYIKYLLNTETGVVASNSTMSILGNMIPTPPNIDNFIAWFDEGMFPNLMDLS